MSSKLKFTRQARGKACHSIKNKHAIGSISTSLLWLQLKAGVHSVINLDPATVQERRISAVHFHPMFRYDLGPKYDLAIVKTRQPFQLTTFVSIIDLTMQIPQGMIVL